MKYFLWVVIVNLAILVFWIITETPALVPIVSRIAGIAIGIAIVGGCTGIYTHLRKGYSS